MAFSKQERNRFYSAIEYLDPDKDYVIYNSENDTLSYSNLIKVNENISGRPTDEELTRALIVLNLIYKYGYDSSRLILEDTFVMPGRNTARARALEVDIMIMTEDKSSYESMIEVKRLQDYKGNMDSNIKNQLFNAYENITKYEKVQNLYFVSCEIPMSPDIFSLICIGIKTEFSKTYEEWCLQGKPTYLIDFLNANSDYFTQNAYMKLSEKENATAEFKDLSDNFSIDAIRRAWRTIWDAIWGGSLESNKKFENFNKILLAKIYDERKTALGVQYTFQRKLKAGKYQDDIELSKDIDYLYRKAYIEYLSKEKQIDIKTIKGIDFSEFSYDLVAVCVRELCQYSFDKNLYKNVDILGEFYEMVIRESFKQTKGLFLTHPNIVLFILTVLDTDELVIKKLRDPDEDTRYRLPFVIDPSCGTGTFLVYYMNYVQKLIDKEYASIAAGDSDVINFIRREMQKENKYKWVKDYVFGLDNDSALATACQINQILHGDGSTNIYFANGLEDFEKYADLDIIGAHNILSSGTIENLHYYGKKVLNKFDIIISNPPFNVNINKNMLNNRFEVSGKSETYFLERWYQLLKPKGRLGVVLPESFFSVEDDIDGREFLYMHFNIKCIVSLPNFTFSPHTTTSTSLLFAEKKSIEEEEAFNDTYLKIENDFKRKFNSIISIFPTMRKNVNFTNLMAKNGIRKLLKKAESKAEKSFGKGFITFPYLCDEFISDEDNYSMIKKRIKDVINNVKTRWIICKIHQNNNIYFTNYSVENIGYKAGKKGSKDKPNELMTICNENNKQIYDLKYAHSWEYINYNDVGTVLGLIKEKKIWE